MKALSSVLAIFFLTGFKAHAQIICSTPLKAHFFSIDHQGVKILEESPLKKERARKIASKNIKVGSLNKQFVHAGNKYVIHIKKQDNFSPAEDYVVISNNRQHKITLPLFCQ